jgi:3'(2'), 5'-bisphosphate nucleotidase
MDDIGPALAEICAAAARVILPYWRSGLSVDRKSDDSPVTEADREAEALIVSELARLFPGAPVVAEEQSAASGLPERIGRIFFLVDPLDGTKAFVRGDPSFTVNIALVRDGRPVAGAVAAPVTGEIWHTQGGGAVKREAGGPPRPVRVRPWPPDSALALVSHTMKPSVAQALADAYGFSAHKPMDSSLKLCRLAEGFADIYPRHGPTMEWDIAAGHAVLEAAGGSLLTPEGGPFLYGKAEAGFRNGWFVARGGAPLAR